MLLFLPWAVNNPSLSWVPSVLAPSVDSAHVGMEGSLQEQSLWKTKSCCRKMDVTMFILDSLI